MSRSPKPDPFVVASWRNGTSGRSSVADSSAARSTGSWRIRPAAAAEAPSLARIGATLFRQAYGATHPEPALSDYLADAFDPLRCERILRDDQTSVLVAESATREWIGYAHLQEGRPGETTRLEETLLGSRPLEIVRFYVDAAWHGRGVAQDLMAACVEEARARSCDVIWLQGWQQAAQALAFYRKSGFRVIGTATFHFGERRDADFLLARELTS